MHSLHAPLTVPAHEACCWPRVLGEHKAVRIHGSQLSCGGVALLFRCCVWQKLGVLGMSKQLRVNHCTSTENDFSPGSKIHYDRESFVELGQNDLLSQL
jgi:hypothetical protein